METKENCRNDLRSSHIYQDHLHAATKNGSLLSGNCDLASVQLEWIQASFCTLKILMIKSEGVALLNRDPIALV